MAFILFTSQQNQADGTICSPQKKSIDNFSVFQYGEFVYI